MTEGKNGFWAVSDGGIVWSHAFLENLFVEKKITIIRYGTVQVMERLCALAWSLKLKIERPQNIEHCTLNKEYWTLNISMSDGTIVCVGLILNVAGSLRGSNQKPKFDHTAVPHASTDGTLMGGGMPHTWKSNNARKYYQVAGGKCHKCSMGKHQL